MAIERNPLLTIPVRTYTHYSQCDHWLLSNIGEWNVAWWRDFPDTAASVLGEVPQPDCYWFTSEKDAVMFSLKFK